MNVRSVISASVSNQASNSALEATSIASTALQHESYASELVKSQLDL